MAKHLAADLIQVIVYTYRRSRWVFQLPSLLLRPKDPELVIDRPIFLLGVQGGGLTLISRMLRRHERVVSVTGNNSYWAGADEMQMVLGPILPFELTGIRHKAPPDDVFSIPRAWVYASDRLLPKYRRTVNDATLERRAEFRRLLAWLIDQHASSPTMTRFTDKSQVLTVRASYINALLEGCGARFILVTRDPYAACSKAVRLRDFDTLRGTHSFGSIIDIAAQCWSNSMRCALEDSEIIEHFKVVRFEDALADPVTIMREICAFAELEYSDDLIPQPHHRFPRGSLRRDRWYPMRLDVNDRRRRDLDTDAAALIEARCGVVARRLGYGSP